MQKFEIKEDTKLAHIKWNSISVHIDTDTGEILNWKEQKNNYIIIKKTKHANINKKWGTITHTNECKRTNQAKLPFD